jgi:hypothetical protein
MRNKAICCSAFLILLLCPLFAPAMAASVAQGKCVSYDQEKKTVTIEEFGLNFTQEYQYGNPTGKQAVFNVANALIGATPEPGDILRIAYEEKGGEKSAIRIMNVSKQDLMKK